MVKKLQADMDEIKQLLLQSPKPEPPPATDQLNAFADFASGGVGAVPSGAPSPSALNPSAPPFTSQALAPVAPPGVPVHSPWTAVPEVNAQARCILEALGAAEARRGFDPF